ncbi:Barrel-sandwich domain of CusB or HlyD membrane-fusion [Pseudobutyrivibrio sp. ACV-2]|uniref:efflux RND transporter periplasmic adaptor subunit n=1 Tax=Pseudobutyrivibrio sp. ACV-2 TaxID=1520801 RepID=UPI000899E1B4|nr:efflux RND transporter periplasmic adaptor subunit [Pseudobutyrivibrio sp. ACV-2]SEA73577.1 Barrel-sandwich domain of CusB or HlyD membrane-fusion [Pseudobutyrivibrio sp. ACV-2]
MKLKEVLEKINIFGKEEEYFDDEIDEKLANEEAESNERFLKKFNKRVIAAMIAAALLISAIAGVSGVRYMMAQAKETEEEVATVSVVKQDVQKTLSATGTIISAEESGQFATVAGSYPIEEVYVKVGDVVKKGDPLYKLDMKTMQETLSYQQQALDLQNQQNAIAKQNADKALEDAKQSGAVQVNDANRSIDQAVQDKAAADRNQSSANTQLENSRRAESEAKSAYDNAGSEVSSLQSKVDSLQKEVDAAAGAQVQDSESEEAKAVVQNLNNKKAELEKAKSDLSNAIANRESKKTAYESAVSSRQSAEQSLQTAKDGAATAARAVDSATASANNTQNTANNNIINQYQSAKTSELSAKSSTLSAKQEISKSKEELSKAVVYASQDGTVTNVNIVKGQTYSGTDAVVIDNVTSLKATADIDEAQIPQVSVGQKVQIKTDATGDEILEGTVSFVSPTATKNSSKTTDGASTTASVSKSRATYRVDVTLDNTNENLRLGMTAKMTFITAEAKNATVVPSSDIQTDFDGNKYVVVQNADGTTENVNVTTGISDEFYTEIKDDSLKEGDVIVEAGLDGSADAVLDDMGSDGGIYFE